MNDGRMLRPFCGSDEALASSGSPVPCSGVDRVYAPRYVPRSRNYRHSGVGPMKVRSSLKSLKGRHRDCKVVRRKGRVYVINKTDPRFKAKQG